jgi:hypothetical protein
MNLVAPDILAEARGLPPLAPGTALAVGFLLWLWGARGHRFWIALGITLTAGLVGLFQGPSYGMQPLVAGLLLAVAAGALALSLVRVLLFMAGGFAALALMHALAPGWNEPVVSFLAGGLAGILLYRFWITTLTSLVGTLLMAYGGLVLLDGSRSFDAVGWSTKNGALLNWACGATAVMGILIQFLLERRRRRKARAHAEPPPEEEVEEQPPPRPKARPKPRPTLWGWVQKHSPRRAG